MPGIVAPCCRLRRLRGMVGVCETDESQFEQKAYLELERAHTAARVLRPHRIESLESALLASVCDHDASCVRKFFPGARDRACDLPGALGEPHDMTGPESGMCPSQRRASLHPESPSNREAHVRTFPSCRWWKDIPARVGPRLRWLSMYSVTLCRVHNRRGVMVSTDGSWRGPR